MRTGLLALAALAPLDAVAFCGHYVGHAGADLYNQTSQIAIVREGSHTTLTLANDVQGNTDDFALVIPVPVILGEDDIRTVERDLFEALDAYSSPRLVEYSCEDLIYPEDMAMDDADGESGGSPSPGDANGVTVEAEYAVGEYEIVILSATESEGLIDWLEANEYAIGDEASDLLGEYIASGAYFFAAKVKLDRVPDTSAQLSPLQFEYDSDAFALPIRIGTLSSPGEQDLIIYSVMGMDDGQLGIANYPEAQVEDECLWLAHEWEDDFGAFYADRYAHAMASVEGPAWVREYSWSPYHCDPCVGDPLEDRQVQDLGFSGTSAEAHFTRLHMRYGTDVTQDLVLYAQGMASNEQIRFIRWAPELESWFPVCDYGTLDEPGDCDDPTSGLPIERQPHDRSGTEGCGCSAVGPMSLAWLGLLPLLGLRRR